MSRCRPAVPCYRPTRLPERLCILPLANRLFGTAPLPLEVWLAALPFAVLLGGAEELRKALARRRAGA